MWLHTFVASEYNLKSSLLLIQPQPTSAHSPTHSPLSLLLQTPSHPTFFFDNDDEHLYHHHHHHKIFLKNKDIVTKKCESRRWFFLGWVGGVRGTKKTKWGMGKRSGQLERKNDTLFSLYIIIFYNLISNVSWKIINNYDVSLKNDVEFHM